MLLALITIYLHFKSKSEEVALTIGIAGDYAPYISLNNHGDYEGFDIDLIHEIGKILKRKIEFKDYGSLTALFKALERREIDIAMRGLSITANRTKEFDMVHYQGSKITNYILLFWKKIPSGISSLKDMRELNVAVESGSVQEKLLDHYPLIKKKGMEKLTDAILDLQYGSPDVGSGKPIALLGDPVVTDRLKSRAKDLVALEIELPEDYHEFGVGMALRKNNGDLYRELFFAIAVLKREKTIKQLEKKWKLYELED